MRFGSDFIEKVRDASDIVDIVGQFTQLKPAGSNLTGLCPFPDHREKTPSFSVSQSKQVYYCFGCKKAGNVFTFIEQMNGMSFPETIEYLCRRAGIPLPQNQEEAGSSIHEDTRNSMLRINKFAAQLFHTCLSHTPEGHPVREYLKIRRFKSETIQTFQIGWAPDQWDYLLQALRSKNAPIETAAKLGLLKLRKDQSDYFDIFRNRLIFPIHSVAGEVIGFGGRSLGEEMPKYLNSSDSELFHKGRVFYGLNETAKHIRASDQAIVVEGYTDFLSLYQAGIQNVVATLGTALTADHAKLLRRYTQNIVVMFDGDRAGQTAAERSLPTLLAAGLFPRGLILPSEYDPDEFVSEFGPQKLRDLISKSPDLFSIILKKAMLGFDGSQTEKVKVMDRMKPAVEATADSRLRDLYTAELAEAIQVDKRWAAHTFHNKGVSPATAKAATVASVQQPGVNHPQSQSGSTPTAGGSAETNEVIDLKGAPRAEVELLNLALMQAEYLQELIESGIVDAFHHKGTQALLRRMMDLYGQKRIAFDKMASLLSGQVRPAAMLSLHMEKPLADMTREGAKKLISDCSRKVRESKLRAQQKQIASHLKGLEAHDQINQLEQIMNIQKHRRSLKEDSELN